MTGSILIFLKTTRLQGLFAAANIFSSLKLVYIFSVNPYLGPLQVREIIIFSRMYAYFECAYSYWEKLFKFKKGKSYFYIYVYFVCEFPFHQLFFFQPKFVKEIKSTLCVGEPVKLGGSDSQANGGGYEFKMRGISEILCEKLTTFIDRKKQSVYFLTYNIGYICNLFLKCCAASLFTNCVNWVG